MKPALTAAAIATIAALTLAGCGNNAAPTGGAGDPAETTPATAKPQPKPEAESAAEKGKIHVTAVGYGYSDDSWGTAEAVAIVANPTKLKAVVNVDFASYDKAGEVLGQETDTVVLAAGQTAGISTPVDVGENAQIGKVTAEVDVSESFPDDHPNSRLIASDVRYLEDEGTAKVVGKMRSNFQQDIRDYRLTAVCYAGGKIVGGGFTYQDALHRSGAVKAVEVDSILTTTRPDRCDLYGTVDYATTGE